jgi:hypothetical protein
MLANLKIICQFHAQSVHQNSVEIYRGRLYFRAEIYRGRLLTLITGSSSRLLRIRFSADLTMYWFPVHEIYAISDMDLVSKYCYFYHSWDFVPYYIVLTSYCKTHVSKVNKTNTYKVQMY